LADPSKFAVAVQQDTPKQAESAPKVEKVEEKEESDEEMGFGLFD